MEFIMVKNKKHLGVALVALLCCIVPQQTGCMQPKKNSVFGCFGRCKPPSVKLWLQQKSKNWALWKALKENDENGVREALKNGANINTKNLSGDPVLVCAASYNSLKIVKLLIEKGANINKETKRGYTPLMMACCNDKAENAEFLIEKGADINKETKKGETPLMMACFNNDLKLARLLIEKGAHTDVEIKGVGLGFSMPLTGVAEYCNNLEMCKLLLSKKCNLLVFKPEYEKSRATDQTARQIFKLMRTGGDWVDLQPTRTQHATHEMVTELMQNPKDFVPFMFLTPLLSRVMENLTCTQLEKLIQAFKEQVTADNAPDRDLYLAEDIRRVEIQLKNAPPFKQQLVKKLPSGTQHDLRIVFQD